MCTIYETYLALPINKSLLCLEPGNITVPSFCYPVDAEPIGFEGKILYCFLPEFGETVFACNPESCADRYVYPLAKNFEDFISLILACGSANPVEQIVWMNQQQFERHLQEERERQTEEQKAVLSHLKQVLHITGMASPFLYVKTLQANFDDRKIQFRDEYYDVLGIER